MAKPNKEKRGEEGNANNNVERGRSILWSRDDRNSKRGDLYHVVDVYRVQAPNLHILTLLATIHACPALPWQKPPDQAYLID
jgi:hypothetical protein